MRPCGDLFCRAASCGVLVRPALGLAGTGFVLVGFGGKHSRVWKLVRVGRGRVFLWVMGWLRVRELLEGDIEPWHTSQGFKSPGLPGARVIWDRGKR